MGTYGLRADEILDAFDAFLRGQEGDISAKELAKAWNKLARKYKWKDKLVEKEGNK